MSWLVAAAVLFVGIHFLSLTPLRAGLITKLGEGPYRGIFSLSSLLGLVGMGVGFAFAGRGEPLYDLGFPGLVQTTPLTFLAFQLLVLAFLFPNPTSMGGEAYLAAEQPYTPTGIQRITRHPFLWGVFLWATSHLLANGEPRAVVLFGALAFSAAVGTLTIDRKRRAALGERWAHFTAQTSNLPFLAIMQGRGRLALGELGWRPLVPAVVFGVFYATHGVLFGAPLPPH